MTNKSKIIFILLLIFAIGIRVINWPHAISDINVDEAMTAINAKTIAEKGADIYGTSYPIYLEAWGYSGQSVMLMYLMSLFIKVFGFSLISVRLPSLLISIFSIIIFYDLIRRLFHNQKLALFSMAFVSICPWHILQSIWSIDCNMFPHFMLISIYFLYRGINDKKVMLYLSMIFFAFTLYTYGIAIFVVPIFLIICAISLFKRKLINIKEFLLCLFIFLIFSFPIITTYIINALKIKHNIFLGPITIQYFPEYKRTQDMLFFSPNILKQLIRNIFSLLSVILFQYDGLEWNGTYIFGAVYPMTIIFTIFGILKSFSKHKNNIGIFFFLVWFILSLAVGIIINDVNINSLNTIWYPILFFALIGISFIINNYSKIKYIIIPIYTIFFLCFIIFLYQSYVDIVSNSWCFSSGYTTAMEYSTNILHKNNVCYCDQGIQVYVTYQDNIDNSNSECLYEKEKFLQRLNNKKENEAFIINEKNLNIVSIDINNYKYYKIGNSYIIY